MKRERVLNIGLSIAIIVGIIGFISLIYETGSVGAASSTVNMSATINPSSTVEISANSVALNVVPSATGTFKASTPLTVNAYTNSNYDCTITMETSSTSLTSGGNSIATLDNTYTESTFVNDKWGFSTDATNYGPVALTNSVGTFSSTTPNAASITFAAKLTQATKPGTYSGTVNFATTCTPPPPPYMQDMTTSSLATLMPNIGNTATLRDSRDEQDYTVIRITTNKYFMASNLNLAGGTKLDSTGSDVPAGYTQSNPYYTLPASATITSGTSIPSDQFSDNYTAYVFNTGNNTTTCNSSAPCNSYYSWLAATAGGKDSSGDIVATIGYNATYSICPKGWKLPSTTTSNESAQDSQNWKTGDWYTIISAFGANLENDYYENSATFYNNAGPGTDANFLLSGYYISGNFSGGGSVGDYWTSTGGDDNDAFRMNITPSGVNSANYYSRRCGYSVRCIFNS